MKKIISIMTVFVLSVSLATPAFALSPTPVPSPASSDKSAISDKLNQEINNLKEKIASRVSELNLVEKRGMIGTITEASGNQISITDLTGKTRFIDVDEITKFSSPSSKTFGLSDLTKGKKISALGLYNKQSKRLLARFINTSVDPVYVSGTISEMDTKNFRLTMLGSNQKQNNIDIQTTTKIFTYSKDDGLVKTGFTKLTPGQRAFVMGYPDKTDASLTVASRLIVVPSLPKNANVVVPEVSQSVNPAAKR
jgi:hypothetical protein